MFTLKHKRWLHLFYGTSLTYEGDHVFRLKATITGYLGRKLYDIGKNRTAVRQLVDYRDAAHL